MIDKDHLDELEITRRMDDAVRRALSTPPTPTKKLVGKTERAQSQRESRLLRRGEKDQPT
jgi:hypothetical protein